MKELKIIKESLAINLVDSELKSVTCIGICAI